MALKISPSDYFAALADVTRCRIIELLQVRSMPVHELTSAFKISRPAISRHLRVLKDAGLVREEKRGRENLYALELKGLTTARRWLTGLWHEDAPAKKLARKPAIKKPVAETAASTKLTSRKPAKEPVPATLDLFAEAFSGVGQ